MSKLGLKYWFGGGSFQNDSPYIVVNTTEIGFPFKPGLSKDLKESRIKLNVIDRKQAIQTSAGNADNLRPVTRSDSKKVCAFGDRILGFCLS